MPIRRPAGLRRAGLEAVPMTSLLPPARLGLTRDGRLLFAGRAVRTFGFGFLSVILPLHLAFRGFSSREIGAVLTATLVEDAIATGLFALVADRVGRRRVLMLA